MTFEQAVKPHLDWFSAVRGCAWTGPIFVNASCASGPFLSRDRLRSQLPRSFSAGPLPLVVASLLSRLIGTAHRPKELLDLVATEDGQMPEHGTTLVLVKVRYPSQPTSGDLV